MSQVFSMPRDVTQRNMGITKELFLTHERKALTNAVQNNFE